MKHFLYLVGLVFIFTSCENDLPEVADANTDQTIISQNFAEIARANIQNTARQQKYLNQQSSVLSISENEKRKALATVSNASLVGGEILGSYNNIGNNYYRDGNYGYALLFYLTSLDLKLLSSDTEGMALTYRNIALTYQALGDFENAAINFWQSYYLYESLEDDYKTATLLNDLGVVYDLAHDFMPLGLFQADNSLALDYYTQSIDLRESLGDSEGIAQAEANIGLLFQTYTQKANSINSRTDLEPSRDQDDVEDEL